MKSTYKFIALQGYALPPTASGHNPATRRMTHFSEHSLGNKISIQIDCPDDINALARFY